MGFTPNTRFFIATKGRMRGVSVVTVDPDPACLNISSHTVGEVLVTSPNTCAEAVFGIVSQCQRFGFVFKRGNGNHRTKNLFLEDSHLVVALQ
ncbi:Uncharacterised protein [Vibrio cholerae]|nr:Uncharacterised protein [Vibrio cholerae]